MYKMYILVNSDIKISKGKLAGQVGHAVDSYIFYGMRNIIDSLKSSNPYDKIFLEKLDAYHSTGQKKVILKYPQTALEELELHNDNHQYQVIRDLGLTQLEPNTLTCVNIGIFEVGSEPEWVKELKLY